MYLLFYNDEAIVVALDKVSFIVEVCGTLYERGIGTTPQWFAYYVDIAEKIKNHIVPAFGKYSVMYISPEGVVK